MAAAILEQTGVPVGVDVGRWGEFTVRLDGRVIATRRWLRAPAIEAVVDAVAGRTPPAPAEDVSVRS